MRSSALLVLILTLVALAGGAAPVVAEEPSAETVAASVPASSFTFKSNEVDLREVLQAIARAGGFNLVMDKDVRGKVALELKDLPFEMALETVCLTHGFVPYLYDRPTRTYLIVPPSKIRDIEMFRPRSHGAFGRVAPERPRQPRWGHDRRPQMRTREWRRPGRPAPPATAVTPEADAEDRDDVQGDDEDEDDEGDDEDEDEGSDAQ